MIPQSFHSFNNPEEIQNAKVTPLQTCRILLLVRPGMFPCSECPPSWDGLAACSRLGMQRVAAGLVGSIHLCCSIRCHQSLAKKWNSSTAGSLSLCRPLTKWSACGKANRWDSGCSTAPVPPRRARGTHFCGPGCFLTSVHASTGWFGVLKLGLLEY